MQRIIIILIIYLSQTLYFPQISGVYAQSISSMTIVPPCPTTSQEVKLVVNTSFPTSGCPLTNSSIGQSLNTFSVSGFYCHFALQAFCASSDTFSLGILAAGNYQADFSLFSSGPHLNLGQCFAFTLDAGSSVNFTVGNPTASISAQGPTQFCEGDSVELLGTSSLTGTFQWLKNGNAIPNATSASYFAKTTGQYSLEVSSGNCSATSSDITINTFSNPTPTITKNGTLLTSTTAATYQWHLVGTGPILGANSLTHTVSVAGHYFVEVSDANGCHGFSDTVTHSFAKATILDSNIQGLCLGEQITLHAMQGPGFSFQWIKDGIAINGATVDSLVVSDSGSYQVVVSDGFGTDSSSIANLSVFIPVVPTVSTNASWHLQSSPAQTYQWHRVGVGPINAATDSTYAPGGPGTFFVVTTDLNGCEAASDSFIYVTSVPEAAMASHRISVYPNPTTGLVAIDSPWLKSNSENLQFILFQLDGRIAFQQKIGGSKSLVQIQLTPLPNGYYLGQLQAKGQSSRMIKIVVQR